MRTFFQLLFVCMIGVGASAQVFVSPLPEKDGRHVSGLYEVRVRHL